MNGPGDPSKSKSSFPSDVSRNIGYFINNTEEPITVFGFVKDEKGDQTMEGYVIPAHGNSKGNPFIDTDVEGFIYDGGYQKLWGLPSSHAASTSPLLYSKTTPTYTREEAIRKWESGQKEGYWKVD